MPNTPTPACPARTMGQLAYEAWWTAFHGGSQPPEAIADAWTTVTPQAKRAWEATAYILMERCLAAHPLLEGLTYPRQFTVERYELPAQEDAP